MKMTLLLAPLLVATALTTSVVDSVAAAPTDLGEASGATELRFKPLADVAVDFDAASFEAAGDRVVLNVGATAGVDLLSVSVSATGGATVSRDPIPVDLDDTLLSEVVVDLVTPTSGGSLTVELSGVRADGQGVRASDRMWFDVVDGEVVASDVGTQDLALGVVAAEEAAGELSSAQAAVARIEATETSASGSDTSVSAAGVCAPTSICVSGTALWTDSAGATHPIRKADLTVTATGEPAQTVQTSSTGTYAVTFDAVGGPKNVDVQLRAVGPGFRVGELEVSTYVVHAIDAPTAVNVPVGNLVTADFTTSNPADPDDETNQTAFSLHNAMLVAREFLPSMQATPFQDVDVVFPAGGSFYDGQRLNMLAADRWDWDVMHHEYGHFIADQLDIELNPGGAHSSSENFGDRLSKDEANRLAWGEGWPTYFGLSLLVESNAAALNIPNVGDTRYQDTEDLSLDYDVEANATFGEDNELTTTAVLWDLYDTPADGTDTTALGAKEIWDILDAGDPETLSDAYPLFDPNRGVFSVPAHCVFSQMNVSPALAGLASTPLTATSPALTWTRGNGGISGENDSFVVEYRNANRSDLLHSSPVTTSTSYTAPASAWSSAVANAGGTVHVSVVGTETRGSVTGPYRSCGREFTGGPPAAEAPLITSVAPGRYVDTRDAGDTFDDIAQGAGKRPRASIYTVQFAGRGAIPSTARGVVANVTAVGATGNGFVTAFDCALPRPNASSLNHTAGVNLGNEVIISLNAAGEACFYTSATVHLTVDVVGYIGVASKYVPVTPARILETRSDNVTFDGEGEGEGRTLAGGEFSIRVGDRAGVPDDAAAAIINVTAVGAGGNGFVTVHPCASPRPTTASLNYVAGVNRANELIAPLDADGDICIFTRTSIHVLVDVVGYIPSFASGYTASAPARFLDTRSGQPTIDGQDAGVGARSAGTQYELQIVGRNGIPAGVESVVINVTAVQPEARGFVTVHPCGLTLPLASNLNHVPVVNGGNEIVAKLDSDGKLCLFTSRTAHLTADVAGYLVS
jgi:hypothetical protein